MFHPIERKKNQVYRTPCAFREIPCEDIRRAEGKKRGSVPSLFHRVVLSSRCWIFFLTALKNPRWFLSLANLVLFISLDSLRLFSHPSIATFLSSFGLSPITPVDFHRYLFSWLLTSRKYPFFQSISFLPACSLSVSFVYVSVLLIILSAFLACFFSPIFAFARKNTDLIYYSEFGWKTNILFSFYLLSSFYYILYSSLNSLFVFYFFTFFIFPLFILYPF